jgi:purine-binding chemotaxis protein CheW
MHFSTAFLMTKACYKGEKMNQNNQEYDTRKILEQMREEYWRALSEAEAEEAKDLVQMVTIVLGDETFGIPALQAKEILKTPSLTRVPRTPPTVLGIFNLRGKITSVVDIRPVLGLKQQELDSRSRIVIIEVGSLSTGVIVEDVKEITQVPSGAIAQVARTIGRKEYLSGQIELEGKLIVLLNMEKILTAPDFTVYG